MSARSLVVSRGDTVTVTEYSVGVRDPDQGDRLQTPATRTAQAIPDTDRPARFTDDAGEDVIGGGIFYFLEELAPAKPAKGANAAEILDADGERWSVIRVASDGLGTRRAFCRRMRG